MRYIAVFHDWFVKDSQFNIFELEATTEEEAHKEAAITAHRRNSRTCNHCDYVIVPIDDQETLITQRKQALKGE